MIQYAVTHFPGQVKTFPILLKLLNYPETLDIMLEALLKAIRLKRIAQRRLTCMSVRRMP